jgi:hypothetical protein
MNTAVARSHHEPGLNRWIAPIVLVGVVTLLQWHSIAFWHKHVGPVGWAWSLLLELGALWMWYLRSLGYRLVGLVLSILLLLGPLYAVGSPLLEQNHDEVAAVQQRENDIAFLREDIARLERQMDTYLRNSEVHQGWHGRIDDARAELKERSERLRELLAPPVGGRPELT